MCFLDDSHVKKQNDKLAREAQVPLPVSTLAQQLWRAAAQTAGPEASVSEVVRWVERLAGAEIAAPARA